MEKTWNSSFNVLGIEWEHSGDLFSMGISIAKKSHFFRTSNLVCSNLTNRINSLSVLKVRRTLQLSKKGFENISTIIGSLDIATWSWGIFQQDFAKFWPKNVKIIKNFADKAQYLYIFGKYMTVGTSMKKISSLALLVRQLRWGVIFTPPHTIGVYTIAHTK